MENSAVIVKEKKLKKVYKDDQRMESFYSGGKISISADGDYFVCMHGEDLKIVDMITGKVRSTLKGDGSQVLGVAINPVNTHRLVSVHLSLQIKYWDLTTNTNIRSFRGNTSPITALDFDPTGTLIATGSSDRNVRVWDIEGGFCTHSYNCNSDGVVSLLKFRMGEKKEDFILVGGTSDGSLMYWDLFKKKHAVTLKDHTSLVSGVGFEDNWNIISAGRDKVVTSWDLKKKKVLQTVAIYEEIEGLVLLGYSNQIKLPSKIEQLAKKIGSPLPMVITGGSDGILKLWAVGNGTAQCLWKEDPTYQPKENFLKEESETEDEDEKKKEDVNVKYTIVSMDWCKKTQNLIVTTSERNIFIYNTETLKRVKQLVGYNDQILDIKYIKEGTVFNKIGMATNSELVQIVDLPSFGSYFMHGHTDIVMCIDVSKDGRFLVSGSKDTTARVWNLENFQCIAVCVGHTATIGALVISRRSNSFVVSASQDNTLKFWRFSQDTVSCTSTVFAHKKDINALAISPNDKIVASASQDRTIKLFATPGLTEIAVLTGHVRGVWSLDFSPVDQVLASSSGDGTIRLWSLTDYTCLKTFEGHAGTVLRVHFLSYGLQLISSGADGIIKLWTIKTNECINSFDGHTTKVWALTVSADESQICSGGSESEFVVWNDYTTIEEEAAIKAQEDRIEKEQLLKNLLRSKSFKKALMIAFALGQPGRVLSIFEEVFNTGGENEVMDVIKKLNRNHLSLLMGYIRDWNTNSRNSGLAQIMLSQIFRLFPPNKLLEFASEYKVNMGVFLQALIPYSERHFQRLDRLLQKSYIIDYSLANLTNHMTVIDVDEEVNEVPNTDIIQKIPQTVTHKKEKKGKVTKEHDILVDMGLHSKKQTSRLDDENDNGETDSKRRKQQ